MADIQTRTFVKHLSRLTNLLASNSESCLSLATELTSRGLIPLDTLNKAFERASLERAHVVLTAVHPAIQGDPDTFGEFVGALEKSILLRALAAEMQREVDCVGSAGNVTSDSTATSRAHPSPYSESEEGNRGSWTCNC